MYFLYETIIVAIITALIAETLSTQGSPSLSILYLKCDGGQKRLECVAVSGYINVHYNRVIYSTFLLLF